MPLESIETALVVVGLVFIIAGHAQARYRFVKDRQRGRQLYWITSVVGIVCFAVGTGKLWPNAIASAVIFTAVVVGAAYMITPYLKIGGQIYASSAENREPDPE
ncbi:hypothetical protein [Mycobacterium rhizamassiliense]|uniref:hypothetical protein n=1 Tax=Mycobacterium rhizamassiliense TaxID=1841860 RepID=UPI001570C1D2|nr:hypothetical protein [Mycobacterium rhizamassiliense]